MSFQKVCSVSMIPTTNVAVEQYRFVTLIPAGTVQHVSANGNDSFGISLEKSANGENHAIPVATFDGGICEVESGAAITARGSIMSVGQGRAITATGATARVLGVALDTAGAAGEFIRVQLTKAAGRNG